MIALVLAALALGGVVLLLARQQKLLGQYQHLMTGTSGGNLESALHDHVSQVRKAGNQAKAADQLAKEGSKPEYIDLRFVDQVGAKEVLGRLRELETGGDLP